MPSLGAARVLPLVLDVTEPAGIEAALDRVVGEFGRIDVLVVNAGVGYSLPVGKGNLDPIRRTIDTNLTGAIATIELALPRLRAQGGGQIVANGDPETVARVKGSYTGELLRKML